MRKEVGLGRGRIELRWSCNKGLRSSGSGMGEEESLDLRVDSHWKLPGGMVLTLSIAGSFDKGQFLEDSIESHQVPTNIPNIWGNKFLSPARAVQVRPHSFHYTVSRQLSQSSCNSFWLVSCCPCSISNDSNQKQKMAHKKKWVEQKVTKQIYINMITWFMTKGGLFNK